MKDVHVLGVHPDGNQIILSDDEGARYSLQITDHLRDACKVRTSLRSVPPRRSGHGLGPREIQERIRAGATPEEISRDFDLPTDKVSRYAGPIIAERAHAARLAQHARIGAEADSPNLGDLVVDRLAARGVEPHTLSWDAVRAGHTQPWEIIVRFIQDAQEREAHWSLDSSGASVSAIDEEAAWLTERSAPAGRSRGSASPMPSRQAHASDVTEALLNDVNAQRGIRQEVDMSEFDDETDTDSPATTTTRVVSFDSRSRSTPPPPPGVEDEPEPTTGTLPGLDEIDSQEQRPPADEPKVKHRRPVPTWEEIMFGSQPRNHPPREPR